MPKLRWLKKWKKRNMGDISNVAEKSAKNFVSQGYAEYVIEGVDLKKEPQKSLTEEEILKEIKRISKLNSELKKEREIKTLSRKTGFTLSTLKKELEKAEVQPEKSDAIKELTEMAELSDNNIQAQVWHLLSSLQFDKATEKMVNFILEKEKIYTIRDDNKPEIFIYKDGIYIASGRSYVRQICREILGRAYTDNRAVHVLNKIMVDTYLDYEDFFKSENLNEICVENGILNTITKELSPFTPEKFFFNKLPVEFNPNATCLKVDKFLSDVLKSPDDKKVFFELAGFGLFREYFIEKAFMFVGLGRNGKGKTLELLKKFVGAENTCSVHLNAMQYRTSAVCELHNRLFNIGGDLSSDALKDTGMFKQLSGRDIVQVPRKYLRDLIFQNYAKHVFACNDLPKVYDKTFGFWSRWILLEFPYTFLSEKEFNNLKESEKQMHRIKNDNIVNEVCSPEELSGLLNEALKGLERLRKNKDFSYSIGSDEIKNFWIRKSDSFMAFCLDSIEGDFESFIPKEKLRKEYLKYRQKHKLKGEGDISIKITLQELFGADEQQKTVYETDIDGRKTPTGYKRGWIGIKFKEDYNGRS